MNNDTLRAWTHARIGKRWELKKTCSLAISSRWSRFERIKWTNERMSKAIINSWSLHKYTTNRLSRFFLRFLFLFILLNLLLFVVVARCVRVVSSMHSTVYSIASHVCNIHLTLVHKHELAVPVNTLLKRYIFFLNFDSK